MKSKTIRHNKDGSIDLIELPVTDPGAGEIQLAGGACGICSMNAQHDGEPR